MAKNLFTSESVSSGHPDKVADQISDAIVQYVVSRDPKARVAVETLVKDNNVVLAGELTTSVDVPFEKLVRDTINDIGYNSDDLGFNGSTATIQNLIGKQSPDINMGVDRADGELGAGDQGIMFGVACDETDRRFPLAITMSHELVKRLEWLRNNSELGAKILRPDSKSQVTVEYDETGLKVIGIDTIVISTQHSPDIGMKELRLYVIDQVVKPTLEEFGFEPMAYDGLQPEAPGLGETWARDSRDVRCLINPTGNFVIGGPVGDAGLTGRKIVVDGAGGYSRVGGGAQSGKCPSKQDRSALYAARWAARNVVAAGLARKVEIQLAYAIGFPEPVSIRVDTFGTARDGVTELQIADAVDAVFDFSPAGIVNDLHLEYPVTAMFDYRTTAAYGQIGRNDGNLPWEKENRVAQLQAAVAQLAGVPAATA